MKLTLHKSQVHSCSVMQWWACSSLVSLPLSAEVGCVCREWIVLLLVFIAYQNHGNKSTKVHFILLWQAFCCTRLLNADVLAGNAAEQWHADSGEPRTFILCEKKHGWFNSNASTSLKIPLLVEVWPMCLSVKLHLCKLLIMQYKINWLVKVEYIYAGLWEHVINVKV